MSDFNPDLAAREVDEELRRDQLNALWRTYGKYVIGAATGIALMVASNQIYNAQKRASQEENTRLFEDTAVAAIANGVDAVAIWQAALPEFKDGYRALATIRHASALAEKGETDAAIASYDALSSDSSQDMALRELAQLQAALLLASAKKQYAEAESRLSVIAVKGKPWYFSASEQMAFLAMQQGDNNTALTRFSLLADDADTPLTIKTRAGQFRDILESKAPVAASNNAEGDNSEG